MEYVFATPGPERVADLARLKAETFRETYAAQNNPDVLEAHIAQAFTAEAVTGQLADPNCTTIWVLDDEEPVGYLKLNRAGAQTEPGLGAGLEIEQYYVCKSHQGRGLGGRLFGMATDIACSEGFAFVWLSVWERNTAAISLYRHKGFDVFGQHTFMVGNEAQTDLMMRLDLDGASGAMGR